MENSAIWGIQILMLFSAKEVGIKQNTNTGTS